MQRRIRRSTSHLLLKGTIVFTLLVLLGIVSVAGIVGSIVTSVTLTLRGTES